MFLRIIYHFSTCAWISKSYLANCALNVMIDENTKKWSPWCTNKWPVAPDVTVCFLHSDLTITSYNSKKALQYVKNDYIPVNYTPALYLHCRG